jgi:hypothetical protein
MVLRNTRREEKGAWILEEFDENLKYAVFSWMHKSLSLVVILDSKMVPKSSRRSRGRLVTHYTLKSLQLCPVRASFQDPALDIAVHTILRYFPADQLILKCPNTHSLRPLLSSISDLVGPALLLYSALNQVQDSNLTSIQGYRITIDFASPTLGCHFQLELDYENGISRSVRSLNIHKRKGNTKPLDVIPKKDGDGSQEHKEGGEGRLDPRGV